MELAPIILFVYNRVNHTTQTIEALKRNDLAAESDLFIYADFPKNETHLEEVDKVRKYIKTITGFKKITVVERTSNWGLANNIIDGVTSLVNKYGKIIVIEDDIVTSKGFLKFMNEALRTYENEKAIAQINGYVYPHQPTGNSLLYLRVLACWGWATWKDRWEHYNHDIAQVLNFLNSQNKIDEFNILGDADYYTQLLNNKSNVIYTWAVRWYASWFINEKLAVFPPISLVQNIGDDNTGEHSRTSNNVFRGEIVDYVEVPHAFHITESLIEKRKINNFYKIQVMKNKVKKEHLISKALRSLLFRFLPETRVLFDKNINWKLLRNTTHNFNLSSTAKVNTPYYIVDSTIEDYSYVSTNAHIDKARIGKFCSIGPNLICGWGIHPTNGISTHPMFYSTAKQNGNTFCSKDKIEERKRINIGNDVFVGANVTILDGVSIGDGAIIGAGAVVSKDIPPYAIAVGNPIKVIKYRFEQDVIDKLLKIKWWEKGISEFKEVEEMFFNIDEYLNKYT